MVRLRSHGLVWGLEIDVVKAWAWSNTAGGLHTCGILTAATNVVVLMIRGRKGREGVLPVIFLSIANTATTGIAD